jgi:dynein heavy chain
LVSTLIKNQRAVLLTGPVGTGKTSVAQSVLEELDPLEYSVLVINISAQVFKINILSFKNELIINLTLYLDFIKFSSRNY